jgi:hypothetical protein
MKTLSVLILLAFVACVPKSMLQPQYAGDDFATVNITSDFTIFAGYFEIDGDPIGEIDLKTNSSAKVSPGRHSIVVKSGNMNISKSFTVKKSDEVYMLLTLPYFLSLPMIKEVSKDDYQLFTIKEEKQKGNR